MSKPTRREKAVILGAPTLLGAALLVWMLTHGTVSIVAMWAYLATAAGLLAWLWIRQRAADRSNDNNERFQ